MKILCLEFSTHQRSVSLAEKCEARESAILACCEEDSPRLKRSEGLTLAEMVDHVLKKPGLSLVSIEAIILSTGPGSFTGIRSAIAFAQGCQLGLGTRALGVSSIHSLLSQAHRKIENEEWRLVIDAQQGEYNLIDPKHAHQEAIEDGIQLVKKGDILELQEKGIKITGPHLKRHFPEAIELYPSARDLTDAMPQEPLWQDASQLEAVYLRSPSFIKAPAPRTIPNP